LYESGMNQSISEVVKIEKQIRRFSQTIPTHRLAPHPASSPPRLWINDERDSKIDRHAGRPENGEPKTKVSS